MANTLKLGAGNWATKESSLLAYNDENGNFKPLPFDFTRASSATRVNKQGLIETVGSNEPRIDFSNDTNGALLLEPSRTNLIPYSEAFDNAAWTELNSATITPNTVISPKGDLTASTLTNDSVTSSLQVINTYTSSLNYTFSAFVKEGNVNEVQLVYTPAMSETIVVKFNLTTQIITESTGTPIATSLEDYGNGWFRISITESKNGVTGTSNARIQPIGGNGDFIYIWGAQVEQGSYATSYIPTSGAAVTRVAEACNNGGNDQVINSTEGVLYAEISALADGGIDRSISLSDGVGNYLRITLHANLNRIAFFSNKGVNYNNYDFSQTDDLKIAFTYKSNDWKIYINGTLKSAITSALTFSPNTLSTLDFNLFGNNPFYGKTKDVRVYNTALTDAELQALTTI